MTTQMGSQAGPGEPSLLRLDAWLGEALGCTAYGVTLPKAFPGVDQVEAAASLRGVLAGFPPTGRVFLHAKADAGDLLQVRFLEDAGFHLVDTLCLLERTGTIALASSPYTLRPARLEDREAVMDLAGGNLTFSRFHQDPQIPRETACRLKAAWAGNYFSGRRGDLMVVACAGQAVVGFLQALFAPDGVMVVDLIAVAKEHRGQGAGAGLIAEAMRLCGRQAVRAGTQLANVGAIRFYQGLGFRLVSASHVFHRHLYG